jgi:dipeptidyl aminopeptidase/acylaminoacyl peptidase
MGNLKKLLNIPIVTECYSLIVTTETKKLLLSKKAKVAEDNNKLISVYKIIYKSQGHKVVGYIAEPKKGAKLPCVIWNRGGNGEFAAIKEEFLFVNSIASLAKAGYIVIASQYSGNAGGEGKDEHGGSDIADVLNLYKILKKYPRADIGRIGMLGGSRGGMMTFLALAKVSWIKAAVVRAPATNLFNQIKNRPKMGVLYKQIFGATKKGLTERSVIHWVDKLYKKAPILMMHGTADWRVNVQDTLDLAKELYKKHIPYRLIIYEGDDHGLTANNARAVQNSIEWFDRFVKNRETLPNLKPHGN